MTADHDWLDDLLDRDPGEPVPPGFAEAVLARVARVAREGAGGGSGPGEGATAPAGRVLRPVFGSAGRWLVTAAVAVVFLGVGFWMGRGRPEVHTSSPDLGGVATAEVDLDELWENREVLEDLDLATDPDLELALRDLTTGGWLLEEEQEAGR